MSEQPPQPIEAVFRNGSVTVVGVIVPYSLAGVTAQVVVTFGGLVSALDARTAPVRACFFRLELRRFRYEAKPGLTKAPGALLRALVSD